VPDADLTIRLQPRASRNAIGDERDGVLRVSAARVEGLALTEVRRALGLRRPATG
jgi:hypothetical protein